MLKHLLRFMSSQYGLVTRRSTNMSPTVNIENKLPGLDRLGLITSRSLTEAEILRLRSQSAKATIFNKRAWRQCRLHTLWWKTVPEWPCRHSQRLTILNADFLLQPLIAPNHHTLRKDIIPRAFLGISRLVCGTGPVTASSGCNDARDLDHQPCCRTGNTRSFNWSDCWKRTLTCSTDINGGCPDRALPLYARPACSSIESTGQL